VTVRHFADRLADAVRARGNAVCVGLDPRDDGQLRIALKESSGIRLAEFRERLRKVLPERVVPWLAARLEKGGLSRAGALKQASACTFGFGPGDIVTEVMSFGSSTPGWTSRPGSTTWCRCRCRPWSPGP
jgi:hypothetical protein